MVDRSGKAGKLKGHRARTRGSQAIPRVLLIKSKSGIACAAKCGAVINMRRLHFLGAVRTCNCPPGHGSE